MAEQVTADTSPSAKATTKAALVDAGTQLILEQGYHQTGIQDVLQAAGVPKGSFYYYFPSKEAFGLAVIAQFADTSQPSLAQGSTPCSDRVHTCQTRRKALSTSRISQGLSLWRTAVIMSTPPAHDVTIWPIATNAGNAPCTTWAICPPDVRWIFG